MLPRLKRFADLLVGGRKAGTALLRRALQLMLAEQHRYQRGTALDRWAFAEIYQLWLAGVRDPAEPRLQAKVDDESFVQLFHQADGETVDDFTTSFLRNLPPQQRLTLLLVYAERFDQIDAARVLDVQPETIASRLVRLTANLADRLGARERPAASASIATLYPEPAS